MTDPATECDQRHHIAETPGRRQSQNPTHKHQESAELALDALNAHAPGEPAHYRFMIRGHLSSAACYSTPADAFRIVIRKANLAVDCRSSLPALAIRALHPGVQFRQVGHPTI